MSPPDFNLINKPCIYQSVQIASRRCSADIQFFFKKFDLGIWMKKQIIKKFVAILLPKSWTKYCFELRHQLRYTFYKTSCFNGRCLYTFQHKKYPSSPFLGIIFIFVSNSLYKTIIFSFVMGYITTQI